MKQILIFLIFSILSSEIASAQLGSEKISASIPNLLTFDTNEIPKTDLFDHLQMILSNTYIFDLELYVSNSETKERYCAIIKNIKYNDHTFEFTCDGYDDFSIYFNNYQVSNKFYIDYDISSSQIHGGIGNSIERVMVILIPLRLNGEISYLKVSTNKNNLELVKADQIKEKLSTNFQKTLGYVTDDIEPHQKISSNLDEKTNKVESYDSNLSENQEPIFVKKSSNSSQLQIDNDRLIDIDLEISRFLYPTSKFSDQNGILTRYYIKGFVKDSQTGETICHIGAYLTDLNKMLLCKSRNSFVRVDYNFHIYATLDFSTQSIVGELRSFKGNPIYNFTIPMGFEDQIGKQINSEVFTSTNLNDQIYGDLTESDKIQLKTRIEL